MGVVHTLPFLGNWSTRIQLVDIYSDEQKVLSSVLFLDLFICCNNYPYSFAYGCNGWLILMHGCVDVAVGKLVEFLVSTRLQLSIWIDAALNMIYI